MLRFIWKNFPVFYMLPFLMATSQIAIIASVGAVMRWFILGLGCLFAIELKFGRCGSRYKKLTQADKLIFVFLAIFLLSELWTIQPWLTAQRTMSLFLLYICSFWTLWQYADVFLEKKLIGKILNFSATIFAINILCIFLLPNTFMAGRFRGFFENPNNIGIFLSLAVPLAAAQWLEMRGKHRLIVLIVLSINLVLSSARSAILGVSVAMLLILVSFFVRRATRAFMVMIASGLGLFFFLQTDFFTRQILREGTLETASNRTYLWELAQTYIAHRPYFGHGFGTENEIHSYYGVFLGDLGLRGHGVMSSYYGLAVQVGWPLTYCFFGFLFCFLLTYLIKYWRNYQLTTLVATLISGLIVCIFEPVIYSAGNFFSFLFWMVFMLAVRRNLYQKYRLSALI